MIQDFENFLRENAKNTSKSLLEKLINLIEIKEVQVFCTVKKVNLKKYAPVLENAFSEALRDYKIQEFKEPHYSKDSLMQSYSAIAEMNVKMIEEHFEKTILENSLIAKEFEEAFSLLKKIKWENLQLYAKCYQDCYRTIGAIFRTATYSNESSKEDLRKIITFLQEIGFSNEILSEEAKKNLSVEIKFSSGKNNEKREKIIDFYKEFYPEIVKDYRGMQTGDKTGIT